MADSLPPIYFYIPESDWPLGGIPEEANTYWQEFGGGITAGVYAWTVQTYQYLKADGLNCELVGTMPAEGIVLAHRRSLPDDWQPGSKLLLVCLKAERKQHPYAQIHVVGNPQDLLPKTMLPGDRYFYPGERYYIQHWPQPGLIAREPARGDRFEKAAFFGEARNLAPELRTPSWLEQLNELGLHWDLVDRDRRSRWNDFSDVDVIVAVRNFESQIEYSWKPALKLYNAWHAGIPAIIGRESASRLERKSELDYIEVTSLNEVISALKKLRDDKEFRQAMIENGRVRAEETKPAKLVAQWRNMLTKTAIPAYERWCSASNWTRQSFLQRRSLAVKTEEMRKEMQQMRNRLGLGTRVRSLLSLVSGK